MICRHDKIVKTCNECDRVWFESLSRDARRDESERRSKLVESGSNAHQDGLAATEHDPSATTLPAPRERL